MKMGFSGFSDSTPLTRQQAFELFKQAADAMWSPFRRQPISSFCTLSDEEPAGGYLASLGHVGPVAAVGSMIWRRAERYTLRVSQKLLSLGPEAVRKIMVHEAGHLGHMGHTEDFRRLVREHGGSVSELALESDSKIQVQVKVGSRYRTVATFGTELEARQYVRAERAKGSREKYRMIM